MNLNVLINFRIKGSDVNLTFTKGISCINAVFTHPITHKIYTQKEILDWNQAVVALCTFLELNGESRESIMNKVGGIIQNILNQNLAVSE
jgi:hypothetical protein